MLVSIALLALLYLVFPGLRRNTYLWVRTVFFLVLGYVWPAAVIPVAVLWFVGSMGWWAVSEFRAGRDRRRVEKRIRRLTPVVKPARAPSALTAHIAHSTVWTMDLLGKERGFGGKGWLDGLVVYFCLLGAVCLASAIFGR